MRNSNITNNFYHFFLYSDTGSCIYKISSEKISDQSLQGIYHALYYTSIDHNHEIKLISTDFGTLSFKSFKHQSYPERSLLLALILPNYFGDEDLAESVVNRIIDYLYSALVMHIGLSDLYHFVSPSELEVLKKLVETYEPTFKYILTNFNNLNLLLKSEKKYEINKEILYPIKHYLENFKNFLKVDFLCLSINSSIVWASPDWLKLDIVDRLLFLLIPNIYSENDINEVPVYFSTTALENDATGKFSFKLFYINLLNNYNETKLIILADMSVDIKTIYDSFNKETFDEFFLSRLINFHNETLFGNMIDTIVKSVVVINNSLKTYKVMVDETYEDVFSKFIQNGHFNIALFKKNTNYDEFYLKDDNFTYYFYKVYNLIFLILYDKNITFEDVNSVKITFNTFNEKFDNTINYLESELKSHKYK